MESRSKAVDVSPLYGVPALSDVCRIGAVGASAPFFDIGQPFSCSSTEPDTAPPRTASINFFTRRLVCFPFGTAFGFFNFPCRPFSIPHCLGKRASPFFVGIPSLDVPPFSPHVFSPFLLISTFFRLRYRDTTASSPGLSFDFIFFLFGPHSYAFRPLFFV